jgi:hypothetical protein
MAPGRTTKAADAAATFTFTGRAVTILGEFSPRGGTAQVTLDGVPARPIDAWIPPRTTDTALWHAYGLRDGRHVLKIVTTGKGKAGNRDPEVSILAAIVFH